MKIWKHSGYLMIGTGVIHNAIGVVMGWPTLKQIWEGGLINSVNGEMDRNAIFWFLFSGFLMMLLGKLMQDYINEFNRPLPAVTGLYLLVMVSIGAMMMPISGFWVVIPQALIIIAAGKKNAVKVTV